MKTFDDRGRIGRVRAAQAAKAQADLQRVADRAHEALAVARELYDAGDGASVLVLHAAALLAIAEQLALGNAVAMIADARASGELPSLTTRRVP